MTSIRVSRYQPVLSVWMVVAVIGILPRFILKSNRIKSHCQLLISQLSNQIKTDQNALQWYCLAIFQLDLTTYRNYLLRTNEAYWDLNLRWVSKQCPLLGVSNTNGGPLKLIASVQQYATGLIPAHILRLQPFSSSSIVPLCVLICVVGGTWHGSAVISYYVWLCTLAKRCERTNISQALLFYHQS